MEKEIVFLFSGQGSQYYNMGLDFYKGNSIFHNSMRKLDKVAKDMIGESILDKLYDNSKKKSDIFDRTLFTHPAIFMTEYSLAKMVIDLGIKPDWVLGTSLGEFTASAISGRLSSEEMLQCVIMQAQCLEKYCERGGMISILCNPSFYAEESFLNNNSELVAVNFDENFVIAGKEDDLSKIEDYLKAKSIAFFRLPVTFAFHSSNIDKAREKFNLFASNKVFIKNKISHMSAVYGDVSYEITGEYLWKAVREPILFINGIKRLEESGPKIYLDLGPSGSLASFAKRIIGEDSLSEIYTIMSPFIKERKNLNSIIQKLKVKEIVKERRKERMEAYVFPGQGSQHIGMGAELFDEFRDLVLKANNILGYSIEELCLEDPEKKLNQTQYTQPALYTVNALMYYKRIKETGRKPDFVAGHSLGEFNALLASGVFDFETGLKIVKYRGHLMSQANEGGMAAVIGISKGKIKDILEENNFNNIYVANYNAPSQTVISGNKEEIENAEKVFRDAGARNYVVLKVSGAFHSKYMDSAKEKFSKFINEFSFNEPQIPIISNLEARPYNKNNIKRNISEQMVSSVQWTDTIRYLMGKGDVDIIQIGPGRVLTRLTTDIRNQAEPLIIDEQTDIQTFEEDNFFDRKLKDENIINNEEFINESDSKPIRDVSNYEEVSVCDNNMDIKKYIVKLLDDKLGNVVNILGSEEFKKDYNLKYPYLAGGMYKGIASKEMIVRLGKAGLMGFFGTGGLDIAEVERAICYIQRELTNGEAYGINIVSNYKNPNIENKMIDLFLKYGVNTIEAAAFLKITPALVKYRVNGLETDVFGNVIVKNRIIAKISRPEIAEVFMSPPPTWILDRLLEENEITFTQAEMAKNIPMADDICAESDSGGHTDGVVAYALLPTIISLRDNMMKKYNYYKKIRVGAAGGIGTPESAASSFMMGADFILTGSINQCTVEAGTSSIAKDLLQNANVQDTEYAQAGDMFEMGSKVQVLKKGVFFPSRANKLYELYKRFDSIDEIDDKTKKQIQEKYFKRSFEEVYIEVKNHYSKHDIERAENDSKYKMALIFKWYFAYATDIAIKGRDSCKVDYQIFCGPALGAFNQWVKGTELEDWRNRHVDEIAEKLINETAFLLKERFQEMFQII